MTFPRCLEREIYHDGRRRREDLRISSFMEFRIGLV